MTEEDARQVIIEITEIELKRTYGESTVSGEDRQGETHVFHFLPATRVRRLVPRDSVKTMAEILSEERGAFPLVEKQEVLVAWKTHSATGRKVVVKFTAF